jgi:hypothetical protein
MITKKNRPMRAIFFRDHEISGPGPAGADLPVTRPGGPGKDLSAANPVEQNATRFLLLSAF